MTPEISLEAHQETHREMYLDMTSASRLTGSPTRLIPSVVRRNVSGMRETVRQPEEAPPDSPAPLAPSAPVALSTTSTTVSETPSMAIEPLTAT